MGQPRLVPFRRIRHPAGRPISAIPFREGEFAMPPSASSLVSPDEGTTASWRERIRSSTFANYHHEMGMALARCGEKDAAVAAFQRALGIDPAHFGSGIMLAELLRGRGQAAAAEAVVNGLRAIDGDAEALGFLEIAESLLNLDRLKDAQDQIRQAATFGKRALEVRADVLVAVASELNGGGAYTEACDWLNSFPFLVNHAEAEGERGRALFFAGQEERAEPVLRRALELDPDLLPGLPHYLLGQIERRRLNILAALSHFAAYVKHHPTGPLSFYSRIFSAQMQLLGGEFQSALTALDAMALPGVPEPVALRAMVNLSLGNMTAADADAGATIRDTGDESWLRVFAGIVRLAQGRLADALVLLPDRAYPWAAPALSRLGRACACHAQRNMEEARRLLETVRREEAEAIPLALAQLGPLAAPLRSSFPEIE
ncbi:tetratricopeptide repeat protein [Azospirillum formosense]|nr:tetratricopeptide repeat protein [Azospirillum formosense]